MHVGTGREVLNTVVVPVVHKLSFEAAIVPLLATTPVALNELAITVSVWLVFGHGVPRRC